MVNAASLRRSGIAVLMFLLIAGPDLDLRAASKLADPARAAEFRKLINDFSRSWALYAQMAPRTLTKYTGPLLLMEGSEQRTLEVDSLWFREEGKVLRFRFKAVENIATTIGQIVRGRKSLNVQLGISDDEVPGSFSPSPAIDSAAESDKPIGDKQLSEAEGHDHEGAEEAREAQASADTPPNNKTESNSVDTTNAAGIAAEVAGTGRVEQKVETRDDAESKTDEEPGRAGETVEESANPPGSSVKTYVEELNRLRRENRELAVSLRELQRRLDAKPAVTDSERQYRAIVDSLEEEIRQLDKMNWDAADDRARLLEKEQETLRLKKHIERLMQQNNQIRLNADQNDSQNTDSLRQALTKLGDDNSRLTRNNERLAASAEKLEEERRRTRELGAELRRLQAANDRLERRIAERPAAGDASADSLQRLVAALTLQLRNTESGRDSLERAAAILQSDFSTGLDSLDALHQVAATLRESNRRLRLILKERDFLLAGPREDSTRLHAAATDSLGSELERVQTQVLNLRAQLSSLRDSAELAGTEVNRRSALLADSLVELRQILIERQAAFASNDDSLNTLRSVMESDLRRLRADNLQMAAALRDSEARSDAFRALADDHQRLEAMNDSLRALQRQTAPSPSSAELVSAYRQRIHGLLQDSAQAVRDRRDWRRDKEQILALQANAERMRKDSSAAARKAADVSALRLEISALKSEVKQLRTIQQIYEDRERSGDSLQEKLQAGRAKIAALVRDSLSAARHNRRLSEQVLELRRDSVLSAASLATEQKARRNLALQLDSLQTASAALQSRKTGAAQESRDEISAYRRELERLRRDSASHANATAALAGERARTATLARELREARDQYALLLDSTQRAASAPPAEPARDGAALARLRTELERLRADSGRSATQQLEIDRLQVELVKMRHRASESLEKLQEARIAQTADAERIDSLEAAVASRTADGKMTQMQSQLQEEQAQVRILRAEIERLEKLTKTLQQDLETARNNGSSGPLLTESGRLEGLQADIARLRRDSSESASWRERATELQNDLRRLEAGSSSQARADDKLAELRSELLEMRERADNAQEAALQAKRARQTSQIVNDSLMSVIARLRVDSNRQAVEGRDKAELEKRLAQMQRRAEAYEKRVAELDSAREAADSAPEDNAVFYIVGSFGELRDRGIIEGNRSSVKLSDSLAPTLFHRLKPDTKFIELGNRPIEAQNVSVLTHRAPVRINYHPSNTGTSTLLMIPRPQDFWAESRFLVVMVP